MKYSLFRGTGSSNIEVICCNRLTAPLNLHAQVMKYPDERRQCVGQAVTLDQMTASLAR